MTAKSAARLTESLKGVLKSADFETAMRISREVDTDATKMGAWGGSAYFLECSRIANEEIGKVLARMFTAYNAERSGRIVDHADLDQLLRQAVDDFFAAVVRHGPDKKEFWGADQSWYLESLNEYRRHTSTLVEEHIRHPGLQPWHQRHSLKVAFFGAVAGGVLSQFIEWASGKLLGT